MALRSARVALLLPILIGSVPGAIAAEEVPTLADVAWMEGHWVREDDQGRAEELWTAPVDGTMVGSFRWVMADGPHVLEFLVMEERDDGVVLRFKHFRPDYVPWERDEPNTYRLTEVRGERAVFENVAWNGRVPQRLIYSRSGKDRLGFRGESPGTDAEPLVLSFTRHPASRDHAAEGGKMSQEEHDRRIDYVELTVPDIEEAKRFYGEVFGWSFTDWGAEYASFHDGRLAGGFARGETPAAGGPLVVLYAIDLEAMREVVVANGGTIVRDIFEFPGGRRFHFRDPAGYELAIWSDRPRAE